MGKKLTLEEDGVNYVNCASNSPVISLYKGEYFCITFSQLETSTEENCHDKRKRLWLQGEAIQEPSSPLTLGASFHIMTHSHTSSAALLRHHIVVDERLHENGHIWLVLSWLGFFLTGFGETVSLSQFESRMKILKIADLNGTGLWRFCNRHEHVTILLNDL